MGFLEERNMSDLPSIPEFYKGKTVFITGGTGFMGKALIEKLLYSCTELERIYLLLRPKRGVAPEDRLTQLYSSHCYERLKKERPGVFESKVLAIAGDVAEVGLGLSYEDRTLLVDQVDVVFHCAASIRFDESLTKATKMNVRGTRDMVELALEMKHLSTFIHVSTAYSYTEELVIREEIHPPRTNWRDLIFACETLDEQIINYLTPKYIDKSPNTYTFTKQLAEHVVNEQKGKLPAVIIRPSIVFASYEEPMPGWSDNFNGPNGISVACALGIQQTLYADPDVYMDYIPVDVCVKGFITCGWLRGTAPLKESDDVTVYNSSASKIFGYTIQEFAVAAMRVHMTEFPVGYMVFTNNDIHKKFTNSRLVFQLRTIFLQVLPALLLDFILKCLKRKPLSAKTVFGKFGKCGVAVRGYREILRDRRVWHALVCDCDPNELRPRYAVGAGSTSNNLWNQYPLVKMQRRIFSTCLVLNYFASNNITIKNENFLLLLSTVKEQDREHFYIDLSKIDMYELVKRATYGARKYLLRNKDEDIPKHMAYNHRMTVLSSFLTIVFYVIVIWWIARLDFTKNTLQKLSINVF